MPLETSHPYEEMTYSRTYSVELHTASNPHLDNTDGLSGQVIAGIATERQEQHQELVAATQRKNGR